MTAILPRFDFKCSPVEDIDHICWDDIVALAASAAGSQGVVFVQLGGTNAGAVVLKCSTSICGEIVATAFAKSLGIPGPKLRLLRRDFEQKMLTEIATKEELFQSHVTGKLKKFY